MTASHRNCIAHRVQPRDPAIRLLCIARRDQRAIRYVHTRARDSRRGGREGREQHDTVMTQTSCILVPHKAIRVRLRARARATEEDPCRRLILSASRRKDETNERRERLVVGGRRASVVAVIVVVVAEFVMLNEDARVSYTSLYGAPFQCAFNTQTFCEFYLVRDN